MLKFDFHIQLTSIPVIAQCLGPNCPNNRTFLPVTGQSYQQLTRAKKQAETKGEPTRNRLRGWVIGVALRCCHLPQPPLFLLCRPNYMHMFPAVAPPPPAATWALSPVGITATSDGYHDFCTVPNSRTGICSTVWCAPISNFVTHISQPPSSPTVR